MSTRTHKSVRNIKVGLYFYVISLILTFISRKIFLNQLGDDFIGLVGTLNSILNLLNLAELGIGSSVSFFLYSPLQKKNRDKINEIISVLGFLYHKIGIVLLSIGGVVSLFFPFIFRNTEMSMGIIYFSFYAFLLSSVIGYFINYRQVLLTADQKNYVVTGYLQTANILKTILQIVLAYYFKNLFVWVSIEFIFASSSYIILNFKIKKTYPWLESKAKMKGQILLNQYPDILKKTKQIFIQKFKDFFLNKSDEILVFAFLSLKMVAFYGNYMIIINKLIYLVNIVSDGMGAGVGNLVAENNHKNTLKVFWELTAFRFIIVGIIIFGLLLFMQPFISLWLGKEYLLSDMILYLLLINIFIFLSRGVVQMYIHAYGLYSDVWASWAELLTNIVITLIAGYYLGISGILLGKIISVSGIALIWKPFYLFKNGIKLEVGTYWKGMIPFYTVFTVFILMTLPIKYYFVDAYATNFFKLVICVLLVMIPLLLLYILVLYKFTTGMKYFVVRFPLVSKFIKR